jgi:hypothetical protein
MPPVARHLIAFFFELGTSGLRLMAAVTAASRHVQAAAWSPSLRYSANKAGTPARGTDVVMCGRCVERSAGK